MSNNVITNYLSKVNQYVLPMLFVFFVRSPLFWLQQQDEQHILQSDGAHHLDE
jgi:hypothetical protein